MAQAQDAPPLLDAGLATLAGSFLGALMLALVRIVGASTGFHEVLMVVAVSGIWGGTGWLPCRVGLRHAGFRAHASIGMRE